MNRSPFERYYKNPIIKRTDIPYKCNSVFNAAACIYKGGYLLLLRIEDLEGKSHLTIARSSNGIDFQIDERPWIEPSKDPAFGPYEAFGVEDPRITLIDGIYYITYTAFSSYGVRIGLGKTSDFTKFDRVSLSTDVDNKDGVLFPEKINEEYVMLTRPGGLSGQRGDIWISYSPDLVFWGKSRAIMTHAPGGWSSGKLGASIPPIRTDEGWLLIYHGVKRTGSGNIYRVGAAILDLEEPHMVIGYTKHFILGPDEDYERIGDVPNVVFPCGAILEQKGIIRIYYGVADTAIATATATVEELIRLCLE